MRYILFSLIAIGLTTPADALRIRNADDADYRLHISGAGFEEARTIEASGQFNMRSPGLVVRLGDNPPVQTRVDQEYIIQDGRLILMRHNYRNHRH